MSTPVHSIRKKTFGVVRVASYFKQIRAGNARLGRFEGLLLADSVEKVGFDFLVRKERI